MTDIAEELAFQEKLDVLDCIDPEDGGSKLF
jgi:hypothetical protein